MQDQAIGYDSSDPAPERWSTVVCVIAGLALAGVVVAISLLVTGHADVSGDVAALFLGLALLSTGAAVAYGKPSVFIKDGSIESLRAIGFGSRAAAIFLLICYFITTWPLARDAPVIFSGPGFRATFWIAALMTQAVPLAYRIWCTSPPTTRL